MDYAGELAMEVSIWKNPPHHLSGQCEIKLPKPKWRTGVVLAQRTEVDRGTDFLGG